MPRAREPIERDNVNRGLSSVPELGLQLNLIQGGEKSAIEIDTQSPPLTGLGLDIGKIVTPNIVRPAGVRGETGYGDVRGIAMVVPISKVEKGLLELEANYPVLSLGDQSVYALTEAMKVVRTAAIDSLTGNSPSDHLLERAIRASVSKDESDIDKSAARYYSSLTELSNALAFFPRGDSDLVEPVVENWPSPIWDDGVLSEAFLGSLDQTYQLILITELGSASAVIQSVARPTIQRHINRLKDVIVEDVIGYKKPRWRGNGEKAFNAYMKDLTNGAWVQWQAEYAPDDPDDGLGQDLLAA